MADYTVADPITAPLILPYLNHAVSMLEEDYASAADIDNAMRFGCGLPIGPLALADAVGLATVVAGLEDLYAATGDAMHEPRALLRERAAAGVALGAAADQGGEAGAENTDLRPIASIGVVGSGTMATGMIEVFARAGYPVTYIARSDEKVAGVRAAIAKSLAKQVERGKLTQEIADEVLGRLTGSTSHDSLAHADLVVEGIVEELGAKQTLFRTLDAICKPGAVLATTTSSLPIAECAAVTSRPEDVIGLHFFNPAPVMKLVEIVHTEQTAIDVRATCAVLCTKLNKVAVSCGDRAGFIVNALLFPYLNDAIKLHESGVGIDEIDERITSTFAYPMGPFALLDVVGLDVSLAIENELLAEFKHEGLTPAGTLAQLVSEGKLGRKTKAGFRTY